MTRQRKMSPEHKAFINSLLEHYKPQDTQDVQDMLKDLLGDALQGTGADMGETEDSRYGEIFEKAIEKGFRIRVGAYIK